MIYVQITRLLVNLSTYQLTNSPTHQLTNLSTYQLIYKYITHKSYEKITINRSHSSIDAKQLH